MPLEPGPHLEFLLEALHLETDGQRLLLEGEPEEGQRLMRQAAKCYWASWEVAPPGSYGRLIGMLKAAVIGGAGEHEAEQARATLGPEDTSPPACYALAIAALVEGDDAAAASAAARMRGASPAFGRAAQGIAALAARDAEAYAAAVAAVVADFEGRDEHLTGVPIADTALMLEALAEPRGMAVHPGSPLLPPRRGGH